MISIFDPVTREELVKRIQTLEPGSQAQWGKMNVYQMTRHCTIWDEWVQGVGNPVYKQEFLGKIFGKMALRSNTSDDRPLRRNLPSGKAFVITDDTGDLDHQKEKWIDLVRRYEHFNNPSFVHDFFGKMTREEIGVLAYKHADHHLRQFDC